MTPIVKKTFNIPLFQTRNLDDADGKKLIMWYKHYLKNNKH